MAEDSRATSQSSSTRHPRRLSPQIPSPLRREWEEAKFCFDAKAYSACTVMVRRTVEGTCMELGVKKRTLALSLKELQNKGLIDGTLAEWATALRVAGNQGAHYTGEPVARDDAEDCGRRQRLRLRSSDCRAAGSLATDCWAPRMAAE